MKEIKLTIQEFSVLEAALKPEERFVNEELSNKGVLNLEILVGIVPVLRFVYAQPGEEA